MRPASHVSRKIAIRLRFISPIANPYTRRHQKAASAIHAAIAGDPTAPASISDEVASGTRQGVHSGPIHLILGIDADIGCWRVVRRYLLTRAAKWRKALSRSPELRCAQAV